MSDTNSPGPFTEHLGFRLVAADLDGAEMEADPGPEHCNGGGILHGGYISSLLDSASGWAVHAGDEQGNAWPHVQINVQFLRAGVPGETLRCTARRLSQGRRIATAEAEVSQGGHVIARATSTHAVIRTP